MKIYNGDGVLLGRLGSIVAKQALLGEESVVINCEKILISGSKFVTFKREKDRRQKFTYPLKSPKMPRIPDRFVRRSIRGMLPHKQERGQLAFKRIMCYAGVPAEYEGKESITIENAKASKLPTLKKISVGELCKTLGGKA